MAIEYLGLAHVALFAKDFDKMYDFYVNKLGGLDAYHMTRNCWPEGEPFWPEGTKPNDRWLTYIAFGNQFVELFSEGYDGDNKWGEHSHTHFCLEIGNMICMAKHLESMGVKIYEYPEGPEISKSVIEYPLGMCNSRCFFIQDPEGNWIELMQFTPSSMQLTCC